MRIATFNINNVNRRLENLLEWLEEARPDVVCLQELKATDRDFPAEAIDRAGYGVVWKGQKTWNGVAILARDADPVLTRDRLPGDDDDQQSRYIEAAVRGVLIAYAGGPDLDNLAALLGVPRQEIAPANSQTNTPAVLEDDTALRRRVLLAPDSFSVAGPASASAR